MIRLQASSLQIADRAGLLTKGPGIRAMSLKCIFCKKPVFGGNGMTVPKQGPAHLVCFQADQALRRTFQHLDISALNDEELRELKELVLAEENFRSRDEESRSSDIELF
ncbi:DUF2175 family protein [Teredinibacter turnerae]|nr:DUF2175 family protein [Teredinibacter turnerae]